MGFQEPEEQAAAKDPESPTYMGNKEWQELSSQIQPLQPIEQFGEVKMPMNWPQAICSMVSVMSICAMLIVLFMVLWGPW